MSSKGLDSLLGFCSNPKIFSFDELQTSTGETGRIHSAQLEYRIFWVATGGTGTHYPIRGDTRDPTQQRVFRSLKAAKRYIENTKGILEDKSSYYITSQRTSVYNYKEQLGITCWQVASVERQQHFVETDSDAEDEVQPETGCGCYFLHTNNSSDEEEEQQESDSDARSTETDDEELEPSAVPNPKPPQQDSSSRSSTEAAPTTSTAVQKYRIFYIINSIAAVYWGPVLDWGQRETPPEEPQQQEDTCSAETEEHELNFNSVEEAKQFITDYGGNDKSIYYITTSTEHDPEYLDHLGVSTLMMEGGHPHPHPPATASSAAAAAAEQEEETEVPPVPLPLGPTVEDRDEIKRRKLENKMLDLCNSGFQDQCTFCSIKARV
jgi:hypothetical protein